MGEIEGGKGRESAVYIVFFLQLSQCVMTHNMANYLQIEEDSDAKGTHTLVCRNVCY